MPSIFGQLREILLNEFTEAEVKMLCDRMGIDFEDLAGTGLFGKTRELLLVTQQQNRLPQLLAHMRVMQPQAFDDYDQADLATAAEFDSSTDARPSREPSSEKDVPFTDVARETEQSYVVTPQTRLPFLIALIAAIVILGALIVFLPVLLNQNRASGVQTSAEPTSAAADATVQTGQAGTVATNTSQLASPSPITNTGDTSAVVGIVVVATPAPISEIPVISGGADPRATQSAPAADNGTSTHPAARAVHDANVMLLALYRGEIAATAIQARWSNEAYQVAMAWNEKLPAVMKLKQMPRTSLVVSYSLAGPQTVTSNSNGAYTVVTREYWGYTNPAASVALCDTREYTYSVRETNGKFVITAVTSRILDKRCR
jgi:hypothetical protein